MLDSRKSPGLIQPDTAHELAGYADLQRGGTGHVIVLGTPDYTEV